MRHGVDYSGGRPGGAAIVAAGYDFVMRYLWPDTPKGLDEAERADLRAHGLAIGLVFESSANRALTGGQQGGRDDAIYADARRVTLGIPDGTTIYFAVDTMVYPDQYAAVGEYFRGINAHLPRNLVGAYAGKQLAAWLFARSLTHRVWQPGALYWSNGEIDETANIRQLATGGSVNGVGIDPNEGYDDMGLWEPEEDQVNDDILLALFSGSEEEALSRDERLKNARYRLSLIVDPTKRPDPPDGPTQSFTERIRRSAEVGDHTHKAETSVFGPYIGGVQR